MYTWTTVCTKHNADIHIQQTEGIKHSTLTTTNDNPWSTLHPVSSMFRVCTVLNCSLYQRRSLRNNLRWVGLGDGATHPKMKIVWQFQSWGCKQHLFFQCPLVAFMIFHGAHRCPSMPVSLSSSTAAASLLSRKACSNISTCGNWRYVLIIFGKQSENNQNLSFSHWDGGNLTKKKHSS